MQYSPKLKIAMEEIKAIITKHDIAALIVLHTPGNSEYLNSISPSYSCAKFESDEVVRFRAKASDFGGDKEKRNEKLVATSNMLNLLSETAGRQVMSLIDLSTQFDAIVDAEHGKGGHTSHSQQNN